MEKAIGVTANAKHNTLKFQEALDPGIDLNTINSKFDHIHQQLTKAKLLENFPEFGQYADDAAKIYQLKEMELDTRPSRIALESGAGTPDDFAKVRNTPELSEYMSRTGDITDAELRSKYKLLENNNDPATFDMFRYYEHRIANGANPAKILLDDTLSGFKANNYLLFCAA